MLYEELKYVVALCLIDDIGTVTINRVLGAFGSPESVFLASVHDLSAMSKISSQKATKIHCFDDWARVDREFALAEKMGVSLIAAGDDRYPPLLRHIYDYPPLLYVKGTLEQSDINVAVVGSRNASTYGKFMTDRISRDLAMKGITVVSGMARGIDSAAHVGAMAAKGRTIAVMGSGMDIIYPSENRGLYEKISSRGAVVTEYPFSTRPQGHHFPQRNRIISGLSLGVVVVEATEKSGSLITARLALEQGREIFAIPGSIDFRGSRGTNKLIKEGAKLVEDVYDIIGDILPQIDVENLSKESPQQQHSNQGIIEHDRLNDEERLILGLIDTKPIHIDTLISTSGYAARDMQSILLSLEMQGFIEQQPGKCFIIKE